MDNFGSFIIILFIIVAIFIICREIICWYYKINRRVEQMDELIQLNKTIIRQNDAIMRFLSNIPVHKESKEDEE